VIAVDTNVLVYAHVQASERHEVARDALLRLAKGRAPWGIPSPCLAEFVRIVTHPRVLEDPYPVAEAIDALAAVLTAPTVTILRPGEQYWAFLSAAVREAAARGNLAFDAAIVAICREAGVAELWTEDRDFHRFSGLRTAHLGDR
jgi:hypothetical protein